MNSIKLFMSGEIEGDFYDDFRGLRNEIEKIIQENVLDKHDYGESIKDLAITPNIMSDPVFLGKERKLVKHKDKSADIRLKIDHTSFANGTEEQREKLLLKNIIQSIRVVGEKVKKGFDAERLEADIRKEFDYYDSF